MERRISLLAALTLLVTVASTAFTQDREGRKAIAVLGAGCFWCTEAVFEGLVGVEDVVVGYAGGEKGDVPTDMEVNSGKTGHAQVVQITYDTSMVSFPMLLELFWRAHNPTTPNRQGADIGPQYRSVILFQDERQREIAERSMAEAQKRFPDRIVTEIKPMTAFYRAKEFHQDYYKKNPDAAYCRVVIRPKLKELKLGE